MSLRSTSRLIVLFIVAIESGADARCNITAFAGAGYSSTAYDPLLNEIDRELSGCDGTSHELCVGHSTDGTAALLHKISSSGRCLRGIILLSGNPDPQTISNIRVPVLVLHGDLDGVVRFSSFAVLRHRVLANGANSRFALLLGANHATHLDAPPSPLVASLDLRASTSSQHVRSMVASLVADFAMGKDDHLSRAEALAARLATPIIEALKLEGSTKLGKPACNSDFPTNPTCQYPKWPDHSLPPGPAKAPNPPLPTDCVCGSIWVAETASEMVAGLSLSERPTTKVRAKDAFHDVSDTHPFHLPHIFNSCKATEQSCVLNMTTLTMPVLQAGSLFPNASAEPLSAFELRSKLKSRQAAWEAAGLQVSGSEDKNMSICRSVNQAAYDWALQHAEDSVRTRFLKHGTKFVMVDDKAAPIGITGPEWIKDELVFTKTATTIEVQSWQFVVSNTNHGNVPWFFPVGMHYCKLLSPARAMEWIYSDSLRDQLRI